LHEIVRETFDVPLRQIKHKMDQLNLKPGQKMFNDTETALDGFRQTKTGKPAIHFIRNYGEDVFDEVSESIEDLGDFYLSKAFDIYKELILFITRENHAINIQAESGDSSARKLLDFANSTRIPNGKTLNEIGTLVNQLKTGWAEKLENDRAEALDDINSISEEVSQLNPQNDSEFERVVVQTLALIDRLKSNISSAMKSDNFAHNLNESRKYLKSAKATINDIVQKRAQEKAKEKAGKGDAPAEQKIIQVRSRDVMKTLFPSPSPITSEIEIKEALARLEQKLLQQLQEGTIVVEI